MSDDSLNQWDAYAMQDCIKGLTKERDNWKEAYRSISNDLNLLLCENDELKAKLAVAVEALEFYADADNYEDQHKRESCGCCYYLQDAEIKEDEGVKARATLAALKGEKYD